MGERHRRVLGWMLVCGGVLVAVLVLPGFSSDLRHALSVSRPPGLDERLTTVQADQVSWLVEQTGGRWGRYGWYLAAGESGHLRIRLPGDESGMLRLRVWAYDPGNMTVFVRDGIEGPQRPVEDRNGGVTVVPVTGAGELEFQATNSQSAEQLVLDRFSAARVPANAELPSSWLFVPALVLGFAGWRVVIRRPDAPSFMPQPSEEAYRGWLFGAAFTGALVVAWYQRWTLLDLALALPVDPDLMGFVNSARRLEWFSSDHGFYSGSFSEKDPLHNGLLNLWFWFWGASYQAARWYSVFLSVALVGAAAAFIRHLSGRRLFGIVAAWMMAVHPVLVEESVRGLRVESMSLLLLAVLGVWLWARDWGGAVLLGITIGLMALLQSPVLSIALCLIWLGWALNAWRIRYSREPIAPRQWRWLQLFLASVLAIGMFVPHLYGLYQVHGDPRWPSYGYARWNANMEFPERVGTPGFPSREEFSRSPYAGPRITYGDYLFRLHSVPTLLLGQIKGWVESTAYMSASATPHLSDFAVLVQASGPRAALRHLTPLAAIILALSVTLTVVGWVDLWRSPECWWVPFLSLGGTWYAAYLYSVRLVEPFRHTGHVYPLLLFCLLWGAYRASAQLSGIWNRTNPTPI